MVVSGFWMVSTLDPEGTGSQDETGSNFLAEKNSPLSYHNTLPISSIPGLHFYSCCRNPLVKSTNPRHPPGPETALESAQAVLWMGSQQVYISTSCTWEQTNTYIHIVKVFLKVKCLCSCDEVTLIQLEEKHGMATWLQTVKFPWLGKLLCVHWAAAALPFNSSPMQNRAFWFKSLERQ